MVLLDTPTELERRIGFARETVTASYRDAHAYLQGWISKWIGVEHAVEGRNNPRTTSYVLTKFYLDRPIEESEGF